MTPLSGLNVFIYSEEGVGPRIVRPIKMFGMIEFPTGSRRQDVSSARSGTLCRQSKNGWQTSTTWSSFLILYYFTNCTIKFSHLWIITSLVVWFVWVWAWLWTANCRTGGTFTFSAIKLKLAFSKMSYCTFKWRYVNYTGTCVYDYSKKNSLWICTIIGWLLSHTAATQLC